MTDVPTHSRMFGELIETLLKRKKVPIGRRLAEFPIGINIDFIQIAVSGLGNFKCPHS